MHTRYSPVRRSPPWCCHHAMPLDLHVLSLPLAFILSQDQTLRCLISFSSFSLLAQHGAPYPGRNPDFLDGGLRPLSIPVSSNAFPVALSHRTSLTEGSALSQFPSLLTLFLSHYLTVLSRPGQGRTANLSLFSGTCKPRTDFFRRGAAFSRRTLAGGRPSAVCGCKGTNSSPFPPNFSSTFFGKIHDTRHNTLHNNSVRPTKKIFLQTKIFY